MPLAISHRGAHHPYEHFPENTIPAFLKAVELGAQGIELDVHATRDGIIVVYHDFDLPDGKAIANCSYYEIRQIEIAKGIHIPTLHEVFDAVGNSTTLYIEAKARNIEEPLARCLNTMRGDFCVHSFHHPTVLHLKQLLPSLRTGILQVSRLIDTVSAMRAANASDLWQHHDYIDAQLINEVYAIGGRVIAWTPNTHESWRRLANLGIDGICTDNIKVYTGSNTIK